MISTREVVASLARKIAEESARGMERETVLSGIRSENPAFAAVLSGFWPVIERGIHSMPEKIEGFVLQLPDAQLSDLVTAIHGVSAAIRDADAGVIA